MLCETRLWLGFFCVPFCSHYNLLPAVDCVYNNYIFVSNCCNILPRNGNVYKQANALEKEAEELLENEGPDCPFLEPLVFFNFSSCTCIHLWIISLLCLQNMLIKSFSFVYNLNFFLHSVPTHRRVRSRDFWGPFPRCFNLSIISGSFHESQGTLHHPSSHCVCADSCWSHFARSGLRPWHGFLHSFKMFLVLN
jgi:hypothetical protein